MTDEIFDEGKQELCKECKYPLRQEREVKEGGKIEIVDYCDNCGLTETLKN